MTDQTGFSQAEFAAKKKTTRRETFRARMEEVIPWAKLLAVIEPHYPKGEGGRPPVGLERMLRVSFLQQWYGLADEALEDALHDSQALRGFARIDLAPEGVPDAITLLKFRHLLETHDLCKGLFIGSMPTSPRAACCCGKARWWTPRSYPSQAKFENYALFSVSRAEPASGGSESLMSSRFWKSGVLAEQSRHSQEEVRATYRKTDVLKPKRIKRPKE